MKKSDLKPLNQLVFDEASTKKFLEAMKAISERDGKQYSAAEYLHVVLDSVLRKFDPDHERWKKRYAKEWKNAPTTEISFRFGDNKTREEFEGLLNGEDQYSSSI